MTTAAKIPARTLLAEEDPGDAAHDHERGKPPIDEAGERIAPRRGEAEGGDGEAPCR